MEVNVNFIVMRKIVLMIVIMTVVNCFAQNNVQYTYDAAGNRIQRQAISTWIAPPDNPVQEAAMADDVNSNIQISAHPNPTNDDVYIAVTFEGIDEQAVTMHLYDVSGKQLRSSDGKAANHRFDLSSLPRGIYLVHVISQDGKIMKEAKVVRE
jgi:hypothetical protein